MINRRTALRVLGIAGIGTAVFQHALAANVGDGPVTLEMIANAEWVAGITLTDAQRETAVNALKWAQNVSARVGAIELDNSVLPGSILFPFASARSVFMSCFSPCEWEFHIGDRWSKIYQKFSWTRWATGPKAMRASRIANVVVGIAF